MFLQINLDYVVNISLLSYFELVTGNWCKLSNLNHVSIIIQGAAGTCDPLVPICFIFMQFSGKQ